MNLTSSLIRYVVAPAWAAWEGTPYLMHYRSLLKTQHDCRSTIEARQWDSIEQLLWHAYRTVPFYRELWDSIGLEPSRIRNLEEYRCVPILSKAEIRERGQSMISTDYRLDQLRPISTSGSTGVPLKVWSDEDSMQWKRAHALRSKEWSGWRLGERQANIWGNPDYLKAGWRGRLRNDLLHRARYLDTLRMDEQAMRAFAEDLVRRPTSLLFGHAHSVYLFAHFVESQGITGIHPKAIITTAMILHPRQRRVIERVFSCPVSDRYGCEEVGLIASECIPHQGLHVNTDGVYVELIRDGEPVPPGVPGSVVVTDLTNRGMPILRYQLGDVAVASERTCPCGRQMLLLERIEGRDADYVVTANGDLISGISLTENFASLVPGIDQIQIIQETVERFLLRIVRGVDFGPRNLERIGELVAKRFGPSATFECEFVDRIPQERSGKYRFCISRVPNRFMEQVESQP